MASENILTPEQLKEQAEIYQQAALQIQEATRRINSMNQQITQEETFRVYLEQYQQLEEKVTQMEQLLGNFHQQLMAYAETAAESQKEEATGLG
ncbi:hypothetical protein D920_02367 [Enterococcus faecalis 13-SD-W-01]|nr:hypothetical protein D920_02367 [Enterococcus faecalis 13-SD-W-01]